MASRAELTPLVIHRIEGELIVLDVVFIAGILALVAVVALVAKGVEKL